MAAAVGWSVEEDGSLSVGEQTVGIAYHPRLNTVLAVTAEPSIKVLDVNSGVVLKKSSLSAPASSRVECRYLSGSDQVFLTDGHSVGLRKDLGGVLLLDSALQTPVTNSNNDVMVEIPYSEASQLLACLRKNKIANAESVMESIEEELERYKLPNDHAYHKTTKWATVHLRLPHATLKKVVNALVVELCRTHQRVSALPICTAILDRLQRLYPDGQEPLVVGGDTTIEKSQMYSEATRRQTFAQWPHMDYKWALPEPMAQAGFYHQPSSIGDDRAMCFTCSVCLVCWEPTDEPWSEHERHSPTCPFVRGEPTHNVPFSVTLSTGPAHMHSKTEKISCVSEGNTSCLMATSTESGRVCIWEVHDQLKLATKFIVNPKDPIFKGQGPVLIDTEPAKTVKQAWVEPGVPVSGTSSSSSSTTSSTSSSTSSGSTGHLPMKDEQAPVNSLKGLSEIPSKSDETKQDTSMEESEREKGAFGSLEVIEVSGAWKVTEGGKQESNGTAIDDGTQTQTTVPELRDQEPSDAVVVSALGMLNANKVPTLAALGTSDMSFPCLVAGVSIRKEDQEKASSSKEDSSRNSVIETDNLVELDGPKGGEENGDDAGTGGAPSKKPIFADAYLGDSVDGNDDERVGSKVAYTNYLIVYCMMYKGQPLPVIKKPGEKASSSSGFHKTQSMYFSLSQETQKLDLEEDELAGYSDLEDPLNFQFSPLVNNNPPPVAAGSGSVMSKQVSMTVSAVQCVELPEVVQTNDYLVTSVRSSLDEQHLIVVLSPCMGKMFERETIDGGISENEDLPNGSKESKSESVQNDLNKGSSPFMEMSNEDCSTGGDEVDTGPHSSEKDNVDARTNQPRFVEDLPPRASSGGFLVIYKLKREGQMISIEKEPCHIHRIASPEDSLSYLTPLPSGVTDASSDEEEVDPYMDISTDTLDKDETDSSSPSIGKWTALTQDGHLIVFDAASFSVLLSILPSQFDFTLASFGPEDKTNRYVALTYCTGMERLCVCTGGGKISFLQLDEGEPSQSIKLHSKADQRDSGKTAILDSKLTAKIDKSSKEFIINSNLTISALHTLHQLTKFEILVPRFSATVPPSWTEIQQEQQQRRHPQHLHQRQQGDALQHTRTWKLQPDGSTSQEHLFEIVLPRMCAVGHIDIKFSLLPFCSVPPGIQITLLQQSEKYRAGDKERMNIKSTPIDAHINFNMNAGSSSRSKEPKEQNLDLPDLPPPFLGALGTDGTDAGGTDEAGTSSGRSSSPHQAGSPAGTFGQPSALSESSFLRRHREDVLCGPCGLELFVDTPSHTGTVMLTSKDLMLWRGRSFLLHIWASDDGTAEAGNGRPKTTSSDQASPFVPQFHTNVDLADRLTTVQLRKDMEKYSGCDWIQELSITVCKSKKVNLPKERFQRALMVESANFHQDLLNTVVASSSLSSTLTEHKQKQLLAFDVLCWVAGVHISEPNRPTGLVEATQYILPEIIRICYLEAERSLAHKCSRFLALCLGCAKRSQNPSVAASFQKALLQSLLQWLPTIACASSSGSLHWFFVILGLVKQADYEAVSGGCMAMLKAAARQLDEATLPQHVVLRAKFGYYGTPLEPTLFDVEPPRPPTKLDAAGPSTTSTGTTTSSSVPLPQIWTEVAPYTSHHVTLGGGGAFDIGAEPGAKGMSLRGKGAYGGIVGVENGDGSLTSGGYFMKGLLEVEPLHFACCGMSDGAHIERIGGGIHTTSSVHPVPQGPGGKGNAAQPGNPPTPAYLATLTNAMATAEKQLQKLKEKTKALVQLKKYNYIPGQSSKGMAEPSPKNSPLFMTPPVSPPPEPSGQVPPEQPPLMYSIPDDEYGLQGQPGDASSQGGKSPSKSSSKDDLKFDLDDGVPSSASLVRNLLHPPSSHMLVIERMHSGARRYAVLDFGRPIVLTDVYIPACSDLTSLSVDIWTQLEEVDGQRLAVAMDIESRDLVLNDLLPPPVCRYLKITVVGNYGSNSPKSKVPLGTFYGHSFIHLETKSADLSDPSLVELQKEQYVGLAMAILDDIQCRYSLATSRLQTLLQAYESYQTESQMDGSFTQTREKMDTNGSIRKAYVECVQLQQQLNVVQRTILRLRQQQHHQPYTMTPISSPALAVKNTSTDALRIMCEHLLEVLLSTTQGAMALPASLCCALDAESCKSIFRHLCVMGTPRLSLLTGTLLVRVCGSRQWWGEFLAAALKEFFQSDQPTMFPQDRVFLLLTSLGQTSLASSNASSVLEDLLRLLSELLSPLLGSQFVSSYGSPEGSLDLPLVGWVLLFLSRVLDHSSGNPAATQSSTDNTQDSEAGAAAASGGATAMPDNHIDKGGSVQGAGSNRWDFLTSQLQAPGNNSQRSHSSARDVVRGVKKQVQSHKDLLYDIKGGKKSSQAKYGEDSKGDPISDFHLKKKLYHQVAKEVRNVLRARMAARSARGQKSVQGGSSRGSMDSSSGSSSDLFSTILLARDKCIPVVQGLVRLLLAMDFTCHVDLFLVTCKVLARIANATRPAITLPEIMSQDQLIQLVSRFCSSEYCAGNSAWGGPWPSHAITCLLLDILEGERLFPYVEEPAGASGGFSFVPPMGATGADPDLIADSLVSGRAEAAASAAVADAEAEVNSASGGEYDSGGNGAEGEENEGLEEPLIIDELSGDPDIAGEAGNDPLVDIYKHQMDVLFGSWKTSGGALFGENAPKKIAMKSGAGSMVDPVKIPSSALLAYAKKNRKDKLKILVRGDGKADSPGSAFTPRMSSAVDARLDQDLEMSAEWFLKMSSLMEAETVSQTFTSLPPPPAFAPEEKPDVELLDMGQTDDDLAASRAISGSSGNIHPSARSSRDLLSACFHQLFAGLETGRIRLHSLLQLWLTVNEGSISDVDGNTSHFNDSRVPSFPLDKPSISHLLATLRKERTLSVWTWCLAFRVLTVQINTRGSTKDAVSIANSMVNDPNMFQSLVKFLSGGSFQGRRSGHQDFQVGPTVTLAFHQLLLRLHLRVFSGPSAGAKALKNLLLRVVQTLVQPREAISAGIGPLDAQITFLELILEQTFSSADLNSIAAMVDNITLLIYEHVIDGSGVTQLGNENGGSSRANLANVLAGKLKAGASRVLHNENSREALMCGLLQLVNELLKMSVSPDPFGTSVWSPVGGRGSLHSGGVAYPTPPTSMSDDDKERNGDVSGLSAAASSAFASWAAAPQSQPAAPLRLADLVLTNKETVSNLLFALGHSSSMAMAAMLNPGFFSQGSEPLLNAEPLSIGDHIFQILATLNKEASHVRIVLQAILSYLSCANGRRGEMLSEPLLWYTLSVLNSPTAMDSMHEIGGIEIICANLVNSSRASIDPNPSIISPIMQLTCPPKPPASTSTSNSSSSTNTGFTKRGSTTVDEENVEGLTNFAPYGVISCSNMTTRPAESLLLPTLSNRRSRQSWAHTFSSEETWCDLTITLPCAVVLEEIHILPHVTNLATCPSAVSVEISPNGSTTVPVCPPLATSGLTSIKLRMPRPLVTSSVCLQLRRPRESTLMALTRIRLLGTTVLGGGGNISGSGGMNGSHPLSGLPLVPPPSPHHVAEDEAVRGSTRWLRLLHHCLAGTFLSSTVSSIAQTAAQTPGLLTTCMALLASPHCRPNRRDIESLLLQLSRSRTEVGLALVDMFLRNNYSFGHGEHDSGLGLLGRPSSLASDSSVDIIYQLGTGSDSGTRERVQTLLDWLGDTARVALHMHSSYHRAPRTFSPVESGLLHPAPIHVHCVAAVLWATHSQNTIQHMVNMIPTELFSSIYEWSTVLPVNSALKRAADFVLCSMCMIQPAHFDSLLQWMGVMVGGPVELQAPITDDSKEGELNISLTDDTKGANRQHQQHQQPQPTTPQLPSSQPITRQEFSHVIIDEAHLSLLALACQSDVATRRLLDSQFLVLLAEALSEFCTQELIRTETLNGFSDPLTDASKLKASGSWVQSPRSPRSAARRSSSESLPTDATVVLTADLVAPVLNFFKDLSAQIEIKNWLASPEGVVFWAPLLALLCTSNTATLLSAMPNLNGAPRRSHLLSASQRTSLENASIAFFSRCTLCHPGNQKLLAQVICDVICTQDLQTGSPFVISGFMRRLILQLMLEDESLAVAVSSVCQLVKGPQSWTGRIVHPNYGLGHKNVLIETKLTTTCAQLITYLTDTLGIKNLPGDKKTKSSSDSSKADKQSFVMVNLSPDKLDVTETEVNGNIGNSIDTKPKTSSIGSAEPQASSSAKLPTGSTSSSSQLPLFGGMFSTVPPSASSTTPAGSSTSAGATSGAIGGATGGASTSSATAGAPSSSAASASSSSSSSSNKQPDKILLYPGVANFPASMVPTLPPELLPKSMDRWAPFFNTFPNPAASMAGAGATSFNMPGLVLSHDRLGSQNFPGRLTIGQAITILQRRGLPEGNPTLEMNIRMSSSLLGASKTDSSKTQEAQEVLNEASASANSLDSDQHIPEEVLLDTPPISSFLEVFARLGGLALIAEHLPQLYQEAPIAQQQQQQAKNGAQTTSAGGSSVDKMTASGGNQGASAAMHSSWWKYSSDLGMKDLGEFEDYEVLMEGPHSTTITSVGGSTLTTTSNVPSYGLGGAAAQLQATSFSNIAPLHTIPMGASSSSSSSSSCPPQGTTSGQGMSSCTAAIPPHSLAAFGLFLRLPGYAEVLLKEQKKAQFLLRLMLGVTDDGDGGQILSSPLATSLPTLPFTVLVTLFDSTPLTTDDGVLLRRMTLEIGAIHLVLACLSVLSHHGPRGVPQPATADGGPAVPNGSQVGGVNDKNQNFWAKGTGFGTGSTTSGWNVEEALVRQKAEEEHVTCLLKVLSSYINPVTSTSSSNERSAMMSGDLSQDQLSTIFPSVFVELLTQSCLIPAISSYLRNDSVLDMSRHVPLYCAVLEILRALALCPLLVHLLLPQGDNGDKSVIKLLENMKGCVDTYTSKLKLVKPSKKSSSRHSSSKESSAATKEEEAEAEGLTQLVPEIQRTVEMVKKLTSKILAQRQGELNNHDGGASASGSSNPESSKFQSADEKYIAVMTDLQFDTFQMVNEDGKGKIQFLVPHHYASNAKSVGNVTNAARARRLAQEAVTLSTSLPLSASSSVFVRCDEDRLDVMKVLITGPSETPYSNGCFEFDIYFPADYPNSPMLVNLETTGQHSVRFNPNLYNDGKVCLSVLNTWHGRPEEKWNSQTSSFLQVLVSIQSLILVSEPYFNEPGYERSRGTQAGTWSSREYDANIMQATVEWGMLDMVRNPPPVFKDVVQSHFYLKRAEVMAQCEEWIALVGQYCNDKRVGRSMLHHWKNLKKHTAKLREELAKLQPPEFLREQLEQDSNGPLSDFVEGEPLPPLSSDIANDISCASVSEDADKSSENDAEHSGSSSSSQEITTAETSTASSQIAEPVSLLEMAAGGGAGDDDAGLY